MRFMESGKQGEVNCDGTGVDQVSPLSTENQRSGRAHLNAAAATATSGTIRQRVLLNDSFIPA